MRGSVTLTLLALIAALNSGELEIEEISSLPSSTSILNMTTLKIMTESQQDSFLDSLVSLPGLAERKFEHNICMEYISGDLGRIRSVRRAHKWYVFKDLDTYKNARSGQSFSGYQLCFYGNRTVENNLRVGCIIPESDLCDDYSTCLADECNCGSDTFLCADGDGCISLQQVCDGRANCKDFSDECLCNDFQTCKKSVNFDVADAQCFIKPDCIIANYTAEKVYDELKSHVEDNDDGIMDVGSFDTDKIEKCIMNKTVISYHCARINFKFQEQINSDKSNHSAGKRDRCFYRVHVDGICL